MAWTMAAFYFGAGVLHLSSPDGFMPIMPDWVPYPREVILATGACEVAGAIALVAGPLRWWAGALLALYAVCVFPANIKHAVDNVPIDGVRLSLWYHIPRLVFQPVLVWWALFAGAVTDWPFKPNRPASEPTKTMR